MANFLCPPGKATEADLAAVADFRAFLAGESVACPVCMAPLERCTPAAKCCEHCPGFHLVGGTPPPLVKKPVTEG